jgi:hypothetical protein
MNSRTHAPVPPLPRLFLDHGADEATCERFRIEEHGVTFESPWQFPLMAELSICLDFRHPRFGRCRTPVEGVVVGSKRLNANYETTVMFFGRPKGRKLAAGAWLATAG